MPYPATHGSQNLSGHQNDPEGLFSKLAGPPPASDSGARGWGLRTGLTGSPVLLILLIPGLHLEKRCPRPQSLLSSSDKLPDKHCCWSAATHPLPHHGCGPGVFSAWVTPATKQISGVPPLLKWFTEYRPIFDL